MSGAWVKANETARFGENLFRETDVLYPAPGEASVRWPVSSRRSRVPLHLRGNRLPLSRHPLPIRTRLLALPIAVLLLMLDGQVTRIPIWP